MDTETPPPRGTRISVNIEEEMRGSYLAYAMSVIIGRALPDVRDGLKPVHRRALFAMYEQRNFYNTAYKKSARIVGDVIGKYHPHGDTAVYDTIVRMAQNFSMRYVLVDGQGNFGSVDGDPAAAMRYTEIRMTRMAGDLLRDIEKQTVDWQENYDGSEQEPQVLPSAYPNLLVNGSGGIAVGMATNMPPHNLSEVIDATIGVINNPEISIDELIEIVPGPDFPTAGFIYGRRGIEEAYRGGRGRVRMRARAEIELDEKGDEKAIIVTELPYQVNKARLLTRIAELVREKKIEGIRDLRDESDRRGMRVYIELKRGAMGHIVLNKLYAMTAMQSTFGIINLAIVKGQPQVLNLKELLVHFVNHRRDVVTRRCRFELRKAEERAHILEGYLIALENIDEVVQLIKSSATPIEARSGLMSRFELSERQAQSILDMRLQRLTGLETDKIKEEYAEVQQIIERLRAILADDTLLMNIIVDELSAIKERYGDARRTVIVDASGDLDMEDLIADEDMVVTVTATGYIKRTPLTEYRTQARGGRGRRGMSTKAEDAVTHLFVASAHTMLLIFSDRGKVYPLKVWELPVGGTIATGKAIVNLIRIEEGESLRSILPVDSLDRSDIAIVFATRKGLVKRTILNKYKNVRGSGIRALNLEDDDDLIDVRLASLGDQVMLVTARGQSIIFASTDARSMGRATRGVRGIRLRGDDRVVAMDVLPGSDDENIQDEHSGDEQDGLDGVDVSEETDTLHVEEMSDENVIDDNDLDADTDDDDDDDGDDSDVDEEAQTIVLVTENGFGKRTPVERFRVQRRGGLGLRALPYVERNGDMVSMCQVRAIDDLMIVTDQGTIIRMPVEQIRAYSRSAKGVRVIALRKGEHVVSIHSVPAGEEEELENVAEFEDGESGGSSSEGETTAVSAIDGDTGESDASPAVEEAGEESADADDGDDREEA